MKLNIETKNLLRRVQLSGHSVFNKLQNQHHNRLKTISVFQRKIKVQLKLRSNSNNQRNNDVSLFKLTNYQHMQQTQAYKKKQKTLNDWKQQRNNILHQKDINKIRIKEKNKLVIERKSKKQRNVKQNKQLLINNIYRNTIKDNQSNSNSVDKTQANKQIQKDIKTFDKHIKSLQRYLRASLNKACQYQVPSQFIKQIISHFQQIFQYLLTHGNQHRALMKNAFQKNVQEQRQKKYNESQKKQQRKTSSIKLPLQIFSGSVQNSIQNSNMVNALPVKQNHMMIDSQSLSRSSKRKFSLFENTALTNYNFQPLINKQTKSQKSVNILSSQTENMSFNRKTTKKRSNFYNPKNQQQIQQQLSNKSEKQSDKEASFQTKSKQDQDQFQQLYDSCKPLPQKTLNRLNSFSNQRRCSIGINILSVNNDFSNINRANQTGNGKKSQSSFNKISLNSINKSYTTLSKNNIKSGPIQSKMNSKVNELYLAQKIHEMNKEIILLQQEEQNCRQKIYQKNNEILILQNKKIALEESIIIQQKKLSQFQAFIKGDQVQQSVAKLINNKNKIKQNLYELAKNGAWESSNVYKMTNPFNIASAQEQNLNQMRRINRYLMTTQLQEQSKDKLINWVKDMAVSANAKFTQITNGFQQKIDKQTQKKLILQKTLQQCLSESTRRQQVLQSTFKDYVQTEHSIRLTLQNLNQNILKNNLLQLIQKVGSHFMVLQSVL